MLNHGLVVKKTSKTKKNLVNLIKLFSWLFLIKDENLEKVS